MARKQLSKVAIAAGTGIALVAPGLRLSGLIKQNRRAS